MKFSKTLLASAISVMLFGVAGCSDSDTQDTQMEDATSFTGLVIDGRIARGFVWLDTDNDNIIDIHEPYAYTDADGYYGYNPLTGVNYCAEDPNHHYCLRSGMAENDFSVKITGGVDLSTGEPFWGVMSFSATIDEANEVAQMVSQSTGNSEAKPDFIPVVSPLTSLVSGSNVEEAVQLLNSLGLADVTISNIAEVLNIDYSDLSDDSGESTKGSDKSIFNTYTTSSVNSANFRRSLFGYAFQLQKTIDTITDMVDEYIVDQGIDIGVDDDGNPSVGSASAIVGKEFRAFIKNADVDPTKNLMSQLTQDDIQTIINNVLGEVISDNIQREFPQTSLEAVDQTVQNVTEAIVSTVLSATSDDELKAGILASQALVTAISDQTEVLLSGDTTAIDNALDSIQQVTDAVQSTEFQELLVAVEETGQTIDIKQLAGDLANGESLTDAVANATLASAPQAGEPGIWANRVLSLSGKSVSNERARIIVFFSGSDETAVEGDVSICYAVNSPNNDDDIDPTLVQGTWLELNSRGIVQLNQDLISFTIKALKQEVIPTSDRGNYLGYGDFDPDNLYGKFRFTDDESQETWYSDIAIPNDPTNRDFGLTDLTGSIPTTADACAAYDDGALLKNLGSI